METTLTAFFEAHYPDLLRYATRHLPTKADAEDVTQDAVLAFMSRYTASPPRNWPQKMFVCLINKINDFYRTQVRYNRRLVYTAEDVKELFGVEVEDTEAPAINNPDEELSFKETMELAELVISKLPPSQKQIYRLIVDEEMSDTEVADLLNLDPRNVRKTLSIAKASIKGGLKLLTGE